MQEWLSLKDVVAGMLGVDRDALHVLVSLPLHVLAASILRRPLASLLPWLLVLLVEVTNEAVSGLADGVVEAWEVSASLRDVPLVMAVPTVLLLLCRFAPELLVAEGGRTPVRLMPAEEPRAEPIVDADFEEIGSPAPGERG